MAANKPEEGPAKQTLAAYVQLLREYPGWRILWIGEVSLVLIDCRVSQDADHTSKIAESRGASFPQGI